MEKGVHHSGITMSQMDIWTRMVPKGPRQHLRFNGKDVGSKQISEVAHSGDHVLFQSLPQPETKALSEVASQTD